MVSGQRSVVGRESAGGAGPRLWWLIPVLVAVPLFAHGCHTGEHDDEPAVAPPVAGATEPEVPR